MYIQTNTVSKCEGKHEVFAFSESGLFCLAVISRFVHFLKTSGFHSPLWLSEIPLHNDPCFLYSSVDGPLGWPHILAVMNRVAMNCLAVLDQWFSLVFVTVQTPIESSFYLPAFRGSSFRHSPGPAH